MMTPLVSIVIPCYNHEYFIQDCIRSVINQTYQNIELIIIDDGSTDFSISKIQEMIELCNVRFRKFEFRYRSNKGLSVTLNEALEWCQGEYYSVIASDDMMFENKTELQVDIFLNNSNSKIDGIFSGYELIDSNNNYLKKTVKKEKKYKFNDIIMHNFDLPAPTAMLKLKSVKEIGGYNENLKIEDWYMWLKLTENGSELLYISQVLVRYRSHDNNFSKKLELMNEERKKVLDCFANNLNYTAATSKLEWLAITDCLYVNKSKALNQAIRMLSKNPFDLLSKNFLRFLYHLSKVKK